MSEGGGRPCHRVGGEACHRVRGGMSEGGVGHVRGWREGPLQEQIIMLVSFYKI